MAEFEITHPDILSPSNKLDDILYAKKHNFSGQLPLENLPDAIQSIIDQLSEKKLLGYELVEEKTVPAGTTSTTFSDLNSDEDGEYLLEYEIITNPTNSISYTSVYINATSGLTIKATGHIAHSSGGGHGIDNLAKSALGRNSWTHSHIFKGECKIQKLNSNYATIIGTAVCIANDYWSRWDYSSTTALSSSINSLIIIPDNGSIRGIIRLWKRLSLE